MTKKMWGLSDFRPGYLCLCKTDTHLMISVHEYHITAIGLFMHYQNNVHTGWLKYGIDVYLYRVGENKNSLWPEFYIDF